MAMVVTNFDAVQHMVFT